MTLEMLVQRVIASNSRYTDERSGWNTFRLRRGRHQPIEIRCPINLPLALLTDLWGLEKEQSLTTSQNVPNGNLSTERSMADSYCELRLPFEDSPELLEEYAAFYGGIRFGKLLEDLDILAACIAYSHCGGNFADVSIVTAAVDRIDVLAPFAVGNYFMQGNVTFVGKSSMEVCIVVKCNGTAVAVAMFTMVARDSADHGKAKAINPLRLTNVEEQEIFARGKTNKERKIALAMANDSAVVNEQCEHQTQPSASSLQMRDTATTSAKLCHSQERNIHNFIFGGYLMKEAYDTAYIIACKFARAAPITMVSLDEILFRLPVPIGSILEFTGKVVYVEGNEFCVSVVSHIIKPDHPNQAKNVTNTFYFTFKAQQLPLTNLVFEGSQERLDHFRGKARYEASKQARFELGHSIE